MKRSFQCEDCDAELTLKYDLDRSLEWWTISTRDKSYPVGEVGTGSSSQVVWQTPCCLHYGGVPVADLLEDQSRY